MTALGEALGLGGPAEDARIAHDLKVIRKHGIATLRHQLEDHAVPIDLYLAVIARYEYELARRTGRLGSRRAWDDFDRGQAADENRQTSRGGNR